MLREQRVMVTSLSLRSTGDIRLLLRRFYRQVVIPNLDALMSCLVNLIVTISESTIVIKDSSRIQSASWI